MVLTPSTMAKLGSPAPEFELKDVVSGKPFSLRAAGLKKAYLVMFLCRHCPYVQHIKDELTRLDRDYREKPVCLVGISSNDAESYPEDAPASLADFVKKQGWQFPFLYDETQETAKRFTAACTPDFFLYDSSLKLAYRGQLDDSRPGNGKPVTGKDLRAALDALLAGKPAPLNQRPSIGCNIKWKSGQEPAYFSSKA